MNKIIKKRYIILIIIGCIGISNAFGQDIDLGNSYFQKGEFEKAKVHFEKAAREETKLPLFYTNYVETLKKLKLLKEAEGVVGRIMKLMPQNFEYHVDYIDVLLLQGKNAEAAKSKERLIETASQDDFAVFQLQNVYYTKGDFQTVVELLERAAAKRKDNEVLLVHLARAYLYAGNKNKMLHYLMLYGKTQTNDSYVKSLLQDNFKQIEEIELLETFLLERIQAEPNEPYYVHILTWHFIQQKDFRRAFIQARALDKRMGLEGTQLFDLAQVASQNGEYRVATQVYEYIQKEYPTGETNEFARRNLLLTKEQIVRTTYPINTDDINSLIKSYEQLIAETTNEAKNQEIYKNIAILKAFYLENYQEGIEIMEKVIKSPLIRNQFRDECKLYLGDIYLLKDEPWEASLLYLQVEKSQREEKLGETAKLKTAKTHYYVGEFELAKEILDILKKATTREIANDAMQLSLLIQDNIGLDSTETAMRSYAATDLLIFQNKLPQAIDTLTNLLKRYKTHPLADEIVWLRATTQQKLGNFDKAIADLQLILKDYPYDILADDALFLQAELVQNQLNDAATAMKLYRQLLQDYPSSSYTSDARKRYRLLRGDILN